MNARLLTRTAIATALLVPSVALSFSCTTVDSTTPIDASVDGAGDAAALDSSARAACGPKPVPSSNPVVPDAGRRAACESVPFVDAVTGCTFIEFSKQSPDQCQQAALVYGQKWQGCRECIFGVDIDTAASDGSFSAPPATPLTVDDGLATVNVGACLALVAKERGVDAGNLPCALAYTRNQWCERKTCSECASEAGPHAYDECRTLTADGACPAVPPTCGLEVSDAGCDVLPDFLQTVRNYAYLFCMGNPNGGDAALGDAD